MNFFKMIMLSFFYIVFTTTRSSYSTFCKIFQHENFFYDSISGNTHLEKWAASSIRRAGLCADHFSKNSFRGEGKKLLKRGSIPLPFRNIASPKENNQDTNMESMPIAMEQEMTEIGNTIAVKEKYENIQHYRMPKMVKTMKCNRFNRHHCELIGHRNYILI
jgi:hypothetical protein